MQDETILIVDDTIINLDILCELLDRYDIIEATNGTDALKIIDTQSVDLILLDVLMPDISGFEICKILKQNENTKDIPIIFITGKTDDKSISYGFDIGGVDYIVKPFNGIEVEARVKNHLNLSRTLKQLKKIQEDLIINTKFTTIGQMSAGITHEINTPLTYIKATLELSNEEIKNIKQLDIKETLLDDNKIALDGINRISIIINSMKEIACVDKLEKQNYNVYDTLKAVLIMIYNRSKLISNIFIDNKKFDIENIENIFTKELYIDIQKQKIEQVWTIILNNALDELQHKPFEQNKILINVEQNKTKNLTITIKNNGGIIKENIINNIFEPFVSNKDYAGIGIGLSVAKKIIDEHNGIINIECYDDITSFRVLI